MTCKQMGGPCDTELKAETAEEMMTLGSNHVKEMAGKGDEDHKKVLAEMEEMQKAPESDSAKEWNEKFAKDFEAVEATEATPAA